MVEADKKGDGLEFESRQVSLAEGEEEDGKGGKGLEIDMVSDDSHNTF